MLWPIPGVKGRPPTHSTLLDMATPHVSHAKPGITNQQTQTNPE